MGSPHFLITIDTEGDNLWSHPREIRTENAKFLPRFQDLAEKYGLKPTWLTNYEMAKCPVYQEFGKAVLASGNGEIGMHLHAWNNPPEIPLTDDDYRYATYLIEYPPDVMRQKVRVLTAILEEVFGQKMTSHRSGRWAFDTTYAQILIDNGYLVDCSVTPHISWSHDLGDPNGSGGTSYYNFPEKPYFMDVTDIRKSDPEGRLLELPMTIMYIDNEMIRFIRKRLKDGSLLQRAANRFISRPVTLRPTGSNVNDMLKVLAVARRQNRTHVEFMLHSSELMPGGSPNFKDEASIENLYADIEQLFETASEYFNGSTLTEYYDVVATRSQESVTARA